MNWDQQFVKTFNMIIYQILNIILLVEFGLNNVSSPNLNGLFHWAGTEVISRYELGCKILQRFGFSQERITASSLKDSVMRVGRRPKELTFELAPLVSKVKTQPATIVQQLEEMHLPRSLYQWYRENVDDPSCYNPRL